MYIMAPVFGAKPGKRPGSRIGSRRQRPGLRGLRGRLSVALAVLALLSHLAVPLHAQATAEAAAGTGLGTGLFPICTGKGIIWIRLAPKASASPQDLPQDLPQHLPGESGLGQPCHVCASHGSKMALHRTGRAEIKIWLATEADYPSYSMAVRAGRAAGPGTIRAPPA